MSYREHVATPIDEETFREPIFVDFLGYDDMRVYEEVTDMNKLKVTLESNLENYNAQGRVAKLDMVLFQQAIIMVARVHRVLSMDRGHLVLAGLPSVGRKTVCRLAAFVEQMIIQRLEVTKNFGLPQFRGKMK
jgi:dynein heavy chain